ncbi:DUF6583 family protein [Oceanobacillus rekensis]|uniref:DUF6583 family protein n=1 Tax=Oceanobacillus rekensis TaxID=937927 RepID=UPI001FE6D07B|nr:DUF6583 family protein [Oceanobacillus rekensis]
MGESTNENQKKGVSKGIIALIIGVLVLAGGTAAAFMMMKSSPKASYFLAEKNSMDYMVEQIENRYQPELDWYEKTQTGKSASTVELTAEYNDPAATTGGYGMDPAMFINNSSIILDAQTDMENRQIYTGLKANIGGIEVNDIQLYLTEEKLMLGLPFLEETIQMNNEDLGPLLHEADPEMFTGEETLGLETIFESAEGALAEEDIEYLNEEYLKFIYDELPEDAFTGSEETVDVNGESINTEKIELKLTEEQLKDLITTVLDKMENDDRLKEIIQEQMTAQQFGSSVYMDEEIETMMADFDTALAEARKGMADIQMPDGLTSTIWIHDEKVVQRDFIIEMGPNAEELVTLSVNGSQLLTETNQFFNYDLGFVDAHSDGSMNISGDLNWEDNQATDSISLSVEDIVLSYNGSETLEDGTRQFDRTFALEEPSSGGGSLLWTGQATYESDQMNSENNLSVETPDFGQDMFSSTIVSDGKIVDSIETLSEENVKEIGGMTAAEIQEYVEMDVTPKFQQWLFGLMSSGGM